LQQYFLAHEETASEWEEKTSQIYPVLAKYQRDGYHALLKRANRHAGAFLCDGVGLGKTFIGLMLIEYFVQHENKNVALFVPKAARVPVWEKELKKRLPDLFQGYSRLKIFSHTDLNRDKIFEELEQVRNQAHVVIIDEAHHFRNTGTKGEKDDERRSRYWRLHDLVENKQVFHLTATPINNSLLDFQHMVELFSRHQTDYFAEAPLGIHSLAGHIRKLDKTIESEVLGQAENEIASEVNFAEAGVILSSDALFDALVVQRSRSYVKESMSREGGGDVMFPAPRHPKVIEYSVKQTYGKLLDMVSEAFHKRDPLFSLPIYYPFAFYKGDDTDVNLALEKGRRKQVVSLIRTNFLKRFESSADAFRQSCWNLLWKLLAWVEVHAETEPEKDDIEHWKRRNASLLNYTPQHDLLEEDQDEDIITPEILDTVDVLSRDEFDVGKIIHETIKDLEQLADFLQELEKFKPSQDKKLRELLKMLKNDTILSKHKVIIFTEFKDTARYLYQQLTDEGIDGVDVIDGGYTGDRLKLIRRFAPYYNDMTSSELKDKGHNEIRVLISTDVLSEGLNLQDATRLINYDLHWNPVRLMQRIGRVDRRMDNEIEAQIVKDHPDQKKLRGTVAYWNFLPPDELDDLLRLFHRVAHKTLRISKTLGIEGKKLLTEDDDFADLKNFAEQYEGQQTPDELMHLEYQDILAGNPELETRITGFPNGIFSGKENLAPGTKAVFFCYARPAHDNQLSEENGADRWTTEAGDVKWYFYDLKTSNIVEDAPRMAEFIRSTLETPRQTNMAKTELSEIRQQIEKHITKTYLRKVQAPIGVEPVLKAWMELN
jgi:superfamily II DNA/RNA helicase